MFTKRLGVTIAAIIGLMAVMPAKAQQLQGEKVTVGPQATQQTNVRGYAKGTVAFFKAIADRDSAQNRCMGYGDLMPDHIVEIQKGTEAVTLQVKSQGIDTTMAVVGPNDRVFCADDSPSGGKDAGLVLKNPSPGTYKVWVGTFDSGIEARYQLSIQAK